MLWKTGIKRILSLSLFLVACQGSPSLFSEVPPSQLQDSIVGGQEVSKTDPLRFKVLLLQGLYDKVVTRKGNSLLTKWSTTQCTTSAISKRLLITAAHCIETKAEVLRIEIPSADKESTFINAVKVVTHPDYPKNANADLALILLESELPQQIEILQLPSEELELNPTDVIAAGFGRDNGREDLPGNSGILRTVGLRSSDFNIQRPTFTVEQSLGKGVCQGDSGGPGMFEIEGKTYIVGIVSSVIYRETSSTKDRCRFKGQYINVQYYLDWIAQESAKLLAN